MASIIRPPMASHPSSQSSPPPSPVCEDSPSSPTNYHHPAQATSPEPLGVNIIISDLSKTSFRPRLPGRQETPPSPPNSVMLSDRSPVSPAIQSSPSPVSPVNQLQDQDHQDQTPPPSLKRRITGVFKVGRKRAESNLSRSTLSTNEEPTAHQETSGYLPSPIRENEPSSPANPAFYKPTIRPNNHFNSGSATKKRVMNGGEVRVEILQHPSLVMEDSKTHDNTHETPVEEEDSAPYYKYTRSSREANATEYEEEQTERPSLQLSITHSGGEDGYFFRLNHNTSAHECNSDGSPISQERIYTEESVSFGFEGFHIGSGGNRNDWGYTGVPSPTSPGYSGDIYSNSGKASSSVLNYMGQSELNILSRNPSSGKSSGAVGRPGISRNASSASFFSPGLRRASPGPGASSGSIQLDEAVTRELRRLSKISAGSGASGFAVVITTDAASTKLEEELSDQELDKVAAERKFTKEEKGKGKAVSSAATESVAERKGRDSQPGKGHQHTISDASRIASGDSHSQNSSDNGDSDGTRELLKGVDGRTQRRKLKSQELQKGLLVHEGDARYDFVYRLRQTSDSTPILVPQYFYPGVGAFPNRNALTAPTRAKLPLVTPINTSAMSFGGQYGSSPITRPQDALKRSLDSSSSYQIRMYGGDQVFDSPGGSPRYPDYTPDGSNSYLGSMTHSVSENKIDSLVHPALRNGEGHPSKRERSRAAFSMGSLEGIAGFGLGRLITGTPNGTGRRLAGSSLADTSDLSIGNRLGDSPSKRVKRVRMSEMDVIAPVSLPVQQNPTAHRGHEEVKVLVPRSQSRLPMRPKILRRSMTPRLYEPRPLGDSQGDLSNFDPEDSQDVGYTREYRMKEKRVSIIVLALCLLFPPLLLLVAMGTFDTMVDGWTNGEVKRIGKFEKKVAAVIGGVFAVAAVVGGVVAAIVIK